MDLLEFQERAAKTDQCPGNEGSAVVIPLMGLAGETGNLLTEYKKFIRDGAGHELFKDQVSEELGDALWYLANLATKFGLSLDEIASKNLEKVRNRWIGEASETGPLFFDEEFPERERLMRRFEVQFRNELIHNRSVLRVTMNGEPFGDPLSDNAYQDDGYRYHDSLHLAHAAILGWSPVVRRLQKRKRKSNAQVDEVEDGARANVLEELIVAFVYDYARRHGFLASVDTLDYDLLRTVRRLTSGLEVDVRSIRDWEKAILEGYRIWRLLREHNGGIVTCDLAHRSLQFATMQV